MPPEINPWSSQPSLEIEKTFSEFGISPIGNAIGNLPEVPYFIRRGIVVGHRDYQAIADAICNRQPVPHPDRVHAIRSSPSWSPDGDEGSCLACAAGWQRVCHYR